MRLFKKRASVSLEGQPERKPLLSPEEKLELMRYDFPLENIALEGGGSKGCAYPGAIRVLEEIGVWQNLKRFAGASAGAIAAMWSALGYDSYEIEALSAVNMAEMTYDARFGAVSLLPNMMRLFGWHPGKQLFKWFGDTVEEKLGNPDATFLDLYRQTGHELCILVVNVNQLDCVYCHVKTTPKMPIRIALRMSVAIPGVLTPVKYTLHGAEEYFCDGGLICNYPIHAFDGWYLSMKPEDNFLRRSPDLNDIESAWDISSKFGSVPNSNTFGMLLYSDTEQEMFKVQLDERTEKYVPQNNPTPQTKKAKERCKADEKMCEVADKYREIAEAMKAFVTLLKQHDIDESGTISRPELKQALQQAGPTFSKHQQDILFGNHISSDELFDSIDTDHNGEITVFELTAFAEQQGCEVRKAFRGFESRMIKDVAGYFDGIVKTLLLNMKRIFMRGTDLHRTMGINTAYLDTLDFDMVPDDKEFLLQQGKRACVAFLRHYVVACKLAEK